MFDEIRKSINSVLHERSTSPFFGSFAISWVSWNWKFILAIFGSDYSLGIFEKIQKIDSDYVSVSRMLIYPLFSSAIILALYPFLSLGAYWIWLLFIKRKNEMRIKSENAKTLTVEQSLRIRLQVRNQEETFNKLLEQKDQEISLLNKEIELHRNPPIVRIKSDPPQKEIEGSLTPLSKEEEEHLENRLAEQEGQIIWDKLERSSELMNYLDSLIDIVELNIIGQERIPPTAVNYFKINGVITTTQNGAYEFTKKGQWLCKKYLNERKFPEDYERVA